MIRLMTLFFITFFIVGCANDNFREQSELGGLRVLAISADTPEINSAALVTLTPIISYVDGGGANLNYTWEACPDPGIDFGADIDCYDASASLKENGAGTFDTSTLSADYFTGNAATIGVNVPAAAFVLLGTLDSDIQFNGLNYLVIVTYTDPGNGNSIKAFKRIKLSTKAGGDLNTNPTFTNITFNGSAIAAYPTSKGNFDISGASSAQSYDLQTNIGVRSFSERMYVSWFSSTGEFLFNRTDVGENNQFTPSGTTGVFVAIYRDGRGGVASQIVSY